ncbi:MAG: vitamin K epoxide reductase family protein [Armatimonadetes bacterium]|nr:vitamin K epoxide reductase family protein [Armatimonadota bacterium]GBC90854.1 hypothetical protein HRbin14_01609 [bacterium HR14]CUU34047.1 Vitamin K epoxide reductase family protein [Armatimonadetes bacterium DC]
MGAHMVNRLIILFSTLGLIISGLLWVSHSAGYALPCTGGGCDEVARSPYARFLGFPTAMWGFGYFGILLTLALSRLQQPEQWRLYGKLIAGLSTLGVLAFAYLTYVQLFVLNLYAKGAPCWWCLGAAVSNLLVWVFALIGLRSAPEPASMTGRELVRALMVSMLMMVIGFGYGYWQWQRATKPTQVPYDEARLKLLYLDGQGWRKGNPNAKLVIVEFSDFQCPACRQAFELLEEQVLPELGDKALFVFRHYPLINIHPMAWVAASAAEEAGAQGKFWEMYRALFETQEGLSPNAIERLAKQLGLDAKKVRAAMDNQDIHFKKIYRDFEEGSRLGVNSTPTFIVVFENEIHVAPGMGGLVNLLNNNPKIQSYLGKKIQPKVNQE